MSFILTVSGCFSHTSAISIAKTFFIRFTLLYFTYFSLYVILMQIWVFRRALRFYFFVFVQRSRDWRRVPILTQTESPTAKYTFPQVDCMLLLKLVRPRNQLTSLSRATLLNFPNCLVFKITQGFLDFFKN